MPRRLFSLLLVSVLAGCTPRIAAEGQCAQGCDEDGDCPSDEVCSTLGTCLERCGSDADCEAGETCSARGACERLAFYCASPDWSVSLRGDPSPCFPYFCDPATGRCRREASKASDCVDGWELVGSDCLPTTDAEDAEVLRLQYWSDHESPGRAFTCRRLCEADADCRPDQMCSVAGECVPKGPYCDPDNSEDLRSVTLSGDGPAEDGSYPRSTTSCGDYACDVAGGSCRTDCVSDFDCDSGFYCQAASRTCVQLE